jgi:hypothetical protein
VRNAETVKEIERAEPPCPANQRTKSPPAPMPREETAAATTAATSVINATGILNLNNVLENDGVMVVFGLDSLRKGKESDPIREKLKKIQYQPFVQTYG